MFEYDYNELNQLNLNNDFDFLYKNLMEVPAEKNKDKDETECYSHKREDLIGQMLMDKLNLSKNEDNRFVNGRELFYYDISFFSDIENKIKNFIKIKTKNMEFDFDVTINNEEFNYSVSIIDKIVKVNRNPKAKVEIISENEKQNLCEKTEKNSDVQIKETSKDELSFKKDTKKIEKSDESTSFTKNRPIILKSVKNSSFNEQFKIKKEDQYFYFRIVSDVINETTYYLVIDLKEHEIDGNLKTNKSIDLKKELGDILFYPKKEIIQIDKDEKILIEVKQNATLRTIFDQMKELMNDLKNILPDEKYCYFGFVNNTESLNKSDEKELIDEIKKYEEENGNFKIFLFILQNNKIFDLELSDNIEYALHFRNELNKKIDVKFAEMKKEMMVMKDEIKGMKNDMIGMKNEMKKEMIDMKNEIKNEMKLMKNELFQLIMDIKKNYDAKGTNNDNSG